MKFLKSLLLVLSSLLIISQAKTAPKEVNIILPVEHESLNLIVQGIRQELNDKDVNITTSQAGGDLMLLSTIIRQLQSSKFDIIMPIGTMTAQMVIQRIKDKPIIAVAANKSVALGNANITGVNDEIQITNLLDKLPKLNKIAVIYSANDKIMPELDNLKAHAEVRSFTGETLDLRFVMVQNLIDLPNIIASISSDIEAFLVLKDHLVVSGIEIIAYEAYKRQIPVIASDEGSVARGASFSIGIAEKDIGKAGGAMAIQLLNGVDIKNIPYHHFYEYSLFINEHALLKQKTLNLQNLIDTAYPIVKVAQ